MGAVEPYGRSSGLYFAGRSHIKHPTGTSGVFSVIQFTYCPLVVCIRTSLEGSRILDARMDSVCGFHLVRKWSPELDMFEIYIMI